MKVRSHCPTQRIYGEAIPAGPDLSSLETWNYP